MERMCMQWWKSGFGRQENSAFATSGMSRRMRIVGGVIAMAVACALTACGTAQPPRAAASVAKPADTELRARLDAAPELVVAGEPLNAALLRRFYARHGFAPVWTTRQAQADSLLDAVSRAGDQGIDPGLLHANVLRDGASLPPLDRELLLSDAVLSYMDMLARGAVPVERRRDDEVLAPEPVDVPAVLDAVIGRRDPGAVIEALAPATPTYLALRQALRTYRAKAAAGDKLAANRLRTIEVNLERERWLPRSLPADRAWVNLADERLVLYRAGQPAFSTRVVVGEDVRRNQSPEFRAMINASFFNPPWVIPKDIVTAEILPKISRDPNYLSRNNMVLLPGGEAEQLPGPEAGLGYLMFDMPNRFDVYLHDTPDREIFRRDNRRLSHGCIRVQDPRELAALLLQEPIDSVNEGIAMGGTTRHELPAPVPVFVVYETAFAGTDGTLQYRPDFYDRDAAIWQMLRRRSPAREATVQPRATKAPGTFAVGWVSEAPPIASRQHDG
jgi:murein L,D-transpeptidase YcbB/YkuD